jgi:hypothetical protein
VIDMNSIDANQGAYLLSAQQRHDLVCGRTRPGAADYFGQPARRPRAISSFDDDAAIGSAPEGTFSAGFYAQVIADPLRDRYLAIARDLCWHRVLRIARPGYPAKNSKIVAGVDG